MKNFVIFLLKKNVDQKRPGRKEEKKKRKKKKKKKNGHILKSPPV
jgi:hypothetical protein